MSYTVLFLVLFSISFSHFCPLSLFGTEKHATFYESIYSNMKSISKSDRDTLVDKELTSLPALPEGVNARDLFEEVEELLGAAEFVPESGSIDSDVVNSGNDYVVNIEKKVFYVSAEIHAQVRSFQDAIEMRLSTVTDEVLEVYIYDQIDSIFQLYSLLEKLNDRAIKAIDIIYDHSKLKSWMVATDARHYYKQHHDFLANDLLNAYERFIKINNIKELGDSVKRDNKRVIHTFLTYFKEMVFSTHLNVVNRNKFCSTHRHFTGFPAGTIVSSVTSFDVRGFPDGPIYSNGSSFMGHHLLSCPSIWR
jgi:hypothetical protein